MILKCDTRDSWKMINSCLMTLTHMLLQSNMYYERENKDNCHKYDISTTKAQPTDQCINLIYVYGAPTM